MRLSFFNNHGKRNRRFFRQFNGSSVLGCGAVCFITVVYLLVVPLNLAATDFEVRYFTGLGPSGKAITMSSRDIPVVAKADVLVAGGGVAGVVAALQAAEEGQSVILIEPRNYFGFEYTATGKCYGAGTADLSLFPMVAGFQEELTLLKIIAGDKVNPEALRAYLLQKVNEKPGITVFFYSLPTGVVIENGRVGGIIMSARDGTQAVLGRTVIDATDDARIAAAAGALVNFCEAINNTARRFIAFDTPQQLPDGGWGVDASLSIPGDSIAIYGKCIELALNVKFGNHRALDFSVAHSVTFEKCFALRDALQNEGINWKNFIPAPETWIDKTPVVVCHQKWDNQKSLENNLSNNALTPSNCNGLLVAGRIVDAVTPVNSLMELILSGFAAGKGAVRMAKEADGFIATGEPDLIKEEEQPLVRINELLSGFELGISYPVIRQGEIKLPVSGEYDVVVAGGGTSGAFAAIAAARKGARVALIEILPNLGGIGSNRVTGYYWGVPWKSLLRLEAGDRMKLEKSTGGGPLEKVRFSGEDKMYVLQDLALKAGVTIFYQSLATAAVVEGSSLKGIVVDNSSGKTILLAKIVIDATGHAGIAVAGGARYHIGRETDGFMNEIEHGPLRDPTNLRDISSSYLKYPSYSVSLNIRENRRIVGDYIVTFDDVIKEKVFDDVICRWRSNYDTHLPTSANQGDLAQDWVGMLGLWRRPIIGSIPYRSMLPVGVENVIVAAMAYSTDHDALIGGRMQPDLEHLGEAAGVAAAIACELKVTPRMVPVKVLQAELVRLGVLRKGDVSGIEVADAPALDDLHRQDLWRQEREKDFPPEQEGQRMSVAEAVSLLGTTGAINGMVDLYLNGNQSVAALRPLLQSSDKAVVEEAALLLGMLGDKAAVPALIQFLKERNTRRLEFKITNASSRPSVPLYWSSVILLGRLGEKAAVPEMLSLLENAPSIEQLSKMRRNEYGIDMFKDVNETPPPLISFILVALGRLGDATAVEAVKPFLLVNANVAIARENLDFEVAWGIRTNAAWTLAQLGDQSGVPTLIEMLNSDQALLRNYSQRLLEKITGKTFGKDQQAWEQWWRFPSIDAKKLDKRE